jgi:hypothetical protein
MKAEEGGGRRKAEILLEIFHSPEKPQPAAHLGTINY